MSLEELQNNDIKHQVLTEDEFDILLAEEAYREYVESGRRSRPIEELWAELNLSDSP